MELGTNFVEQLLNMTASHGYQLKNDDDTITHAAAVSGGQGTTLSQMQTADAVVAADANSNLTSGLALKADKTITVNGYTLAFDIDLTKNDVDLGNVPNVDATNPANIVQDTTHRFVSDTNMSTWSGKQDHATILDELSALPPGTNKMIWVGGSGTLVQSSATLFGVGFLNLADALAARTYIGAGTSSFSGAFTDLTGKPTTLSGYGITDAYPLTGNPSGFLTGITSGQITTALGFTPYNATNPSSYITTAGARTAISLTTIGTSGASTYNNSTGVLNIPNYTTGSGTVTSVGLSSTDFSVSGSPVTTSGNITANLNTSGVSAGTYHGPYTVTTKGIVTSAADPTINNAVARSLSNAAGSTNRYTISATQPARVTYSITMNFTVTALLASSASVFLEYSTNAGSTWVTVSQVTSSFNLGLALSGSNDMSLSGELPINALVRLRPATTNATCTYITGQEVLY